MNITEEIQKVISIGFTEETIVTHLKTCGFSNAEIQQHIDVIKKAPWSSYPKTTGSSILLASIVLIASLARGIS